MNKKTLNIIAVCVVSLIIVFSVTNKTQINIENSSNIEVSGDNEIITKAEQYQNNILETISEQNIQNLKEFSKTFEKKPTDTLTEGLTKDIFTQYIKYNSSGEIKNDDVLKATQDILNKDTSIVNPVIYSDINTVISNKTNLKTYGNNLATIQNGVIKGVNSIKNKKVKEPYLVDIYKKVSDIMIITPVPESLSSNHVKIINGFKKYSEGLDMMNSQYNDPAKSLLGLKKVREATSEISDGLNLIKKTLELNNITYESNEPGFLLNKNF